MNISLQNNLEIRKLEYCWQQTNVGLALVVFAGEVICGIAFAKKNNQNEVLEDMKKRWKGVVFAEVMSLPKRIRLFDDDFTLRELKLYVRGTTFQKAVWQKLLTIQSGELMTYEYIALALDKPKAVRAVGSAVGKNPVAYLIPCHRVIRKDGGIGGFRWGLDVKRSLLKEEGIVL